MKKSFVVLVLVAAVVGPVIYYGFRPAALEVDTTTVRRGHLAVVVEQEGKARVVDRYVVSAPVDGTAGRIELREGDRVHKGQVLVELGPFRSSALDPRSRAEADAKVEVARASLRQAEAAVDAATADAGPSRVRSGFTGVKEKDRW